MSELAPDPATRLTLLGFGAVFALTGAYLLIEQARTPAAAWRAAPVIELVALASRSPGTMVFAQGRLDAQPNAAQGLALWQRQRAEAESIPGRSDLRFAWPPVESGPPMVRLTEGSVSVRVRVAGSEWRDPPEIRGPEDGLTVAGSERVVGFAPQAPIAVLARVARDAEGPLLEAAILSSGDAATLRRSLWWSAAVPALLGGLFLALGGGLIAVQVRQMIRRPDPATGA